MSDFDPYLSEKDGGLYRDPDFFIVCPPRCGSSLLTVLLNMHPEIAIAQDTSVFTEYKDAHLVADMVANQRLENFNFRFLGHILSDVAIQQISKQVLSYSDPNQRLVISFFLTNFFRFHAADTMVDDPRKDRGTGHEYLKYIDFDHFFALFYGSGTPPQKAFNLIINSIIRGSGLAGRTIGEKTPSHALCAPLIASLYPEARFINLIRNPIPYVGSRKQRVDTSIEQHCLLYRHSLDLMVENGGRGMFIRYEDLLNNTDETLRSIHAHLGVAPRTMDDELDSGVYPQYVGKSIDPSRDKKNWDFVDDSERALIRQQLPDAFDRFYSDSTNAPT